MYMVLRKMVLKMEVEYLEIIERIREFFTFLTSCTRLLLSEIAEQDDWRRVYRALTGTENRSTCIQGYDINYFFCTVYSYESLVCKVRCAPLPEFCMSLALCLYTLIFKKWMDRSMAIRDCWKLNVCDSAHSAVSNIHKMLRVS